MGAFTLPFGTDLHTILAYCLFAIMRYNRGADWLRGDGMPISEAVHMCDDGYIGPLSYNERWDAMYCSHCNVWLSSTCKAKKCEFCESRPERPLERCP